MHQVLQRCMVRYPRTSFPFLPYLWQGLLVGDMARAITVVSRFRLFLLLLERSRPGGQWHVFLCVLFWG